MSSITRRSGYQGGILANSTTVFHDYVTEDISSDPNTKTARSVTNLSATTSLSTGLLRRQYLSTDVFTSAGPASVPVVNAWRVTSNRVYN